MGEYQARYGKVPELEIVANHCKMTPGKLQHLFDSVEKVSCGSLDHIHAETGTTYIDLIYCDRPSPEQLIEEAEMQENLGDKMQMLDDDVRQVVERTMLDNHRIKDVSADMEVSTHRVKKLQLEGLEELAPLLAA